MRVFFKMPKSMLLIPSARKMLRPALPTRSPGHPVVVFGAPHKVLKSERPPAATSCSTDMPEIGRVVFKLGRMALPTKPSIPLNAPVGSEPFSGVKGAPLWSEKDEFTCQPPSRRPIGPD